MVTAAEFDQAFQDESVPMPKLLEMARQLAGRPRPCSLCDRDLYFGKHTCHDCKALLVLAEEAARVASTGGPCRFLVLHPDGSSYALPQRVPSIADSVCVDLRKPLQLQLKTAARLRRPEILARARAERAAS